MSYTFLDAYASVQTADSSVISTGVLRQRVDIASIIGAVSTTFTGSPSISGAVTVVGTPSISGAVTVVGVPSISGSVNVPNTVSVAGAVQIAGNSPSSIATVHSVDDQIGPSMMALVTDTVIHGRTTAGGGSYVEVKVDPSGAIVTAMSSVVAFQGGSPWNIAGSVAATIQAGSITTISTMSSVATANGGLTLNAPFGSWVQGTADLRTSLGASVTTIAAQGTSVFTYITGIQVANMGSASVLVTLGGGLGSILGYTIAPAGGGSNIVYPNALKTGANSAFTASISGTASVLVSAQGFTSKT